MKKNLIALCFLILTIGVNGQCWQEWEKTKPGNKLTSLTSTSNNELWGIAPGNSVWRWESDKWVNRNPGNKLISLTSIGSELWGISPSNSVWRWESDKWVSRNPGNKLVEIFSFHPPRGLAKNGSMWEWDGKDWINNYKGNFFKTFFDFNWAIAPDNSVWKLEKNGWVNRNPGNKLKSISSASGKQGNKWGIAPGNSVWRWEGEEWKNTNPGNKLTWIFSNIGLSPSGTMWKFDSSSKKWLRANEYNIPIKKFISLSGGACAVPNVSFALSLDNRLIYKEGTNDYKYVNLPNVKLTQFAGIYLKDSKVKLFAIDEDYQVWSTTCPCTTIIH